MEKKQFEELLLQSLEHERGGVEVYSTAVKCAVDEELKEEWTKYLAETREHVKRLEEVFAELGLDPEKETTGRQIVADLGQSLIKAMRTAMEAGDPVAAELVACECVVLAETKDHADWELIGECVKSGAGGAKLEEAHEQVEEQEDEHLYHTKGWCRELWLKGLGIKAVLPPPEEQKDVKTAIGAERAKKARTKMKKS
jgi:rubrerythrin